MQQLTGRWHHRLPTTCQQPRVRLLRPPFVWIRHVSLWLAPSSTRWTSRRILVTTFIIMRVVAGYAVTPYLRASPAGQHLVYCGKKIRLFCETLSVRMNASQLSIKAVIDLKSRFQVQNVDFYLRKRDSCVFVLSRRQRGSGKRGFSWEEGVRLLPVVYWYEQGHWFAEGYAHVRPAADCVWQSDDGCITTGRCWQQASLPESRDDYTRLRPVSLLHGVGGRGWEEQLCQHLSGKSTVWMSLCNLVLWSLFICFWFVIGWFLRCELTGGSKRSGSSSRPVHQQDKRQWSGREFHFLFVTPCCDSM